VWQEVMSTRSASRKDLPTSHVTISPSSSAFPLIDPGGHLAHELAVRSRRHLTPMALIGRARVQYRLVDIGGDRGDDRSHRAASSRLEHIEGRRSGLVHEPASDERAPHRPGVMQIASVRSPYCGGRTPSRGWAGPTGRSRRLGPAAAQACADAPSRDAWHAVALALAAAPQALDLPEQRRSAGRHQDRGADRADGGGTRAGATSGSRASCSASATGPGHPQYSGC
jgi:hypothetical protein